MPSFVLGLLVCLVLSGGWTRIVAADSDIDHRIHSTKHFVIQSRGTAAELRRLGERCETLLAELRAKWFGQSAVGDGWTPQCELVIHDQASSYLRAVPGGERTVGSSWIEAAQGRITRRRIDVRGDRDGWFESSLPHELIHVLLADCFGDAPMLRWAEEGLALLADPESKQLLHDLDFRRAAASHSHFRLAEILTAVEYPSAARIRIFYGQSASLVRYLVAREGPSAFVQFIDRATVEGYDAALRSTYGIDGVTALEANWLSAVHSPELAIVK